MAVTRATITEKLRTLVSVELGRGPDEITRDADLANDLGADELDLVEIVVATEEAFDIQIDDDKADTLRTFGALVDEVVRLKKSA
jgi:acyl carrier protein